jgi:hypothetical protein
MTVNEKIARWLGWVVYEEKRGEYLLHVVYPPDGREPWKREQQAYWESAKERFRQIEWDEFDARKQPTSMLPQYDADIALWHGEAGLFAEINRRGRDFRDALMDSLYDEAVDVDGGNIDMAEDSYDFEWYCMTADPAILAAALVKVLEEGSEG